VLGVTANGELLGQAYFGQRLGSFLYDDGSYQKETIPGVRDALAYGINSAGTALVGSYAASATGTVGFVYQNGTLTTLQVPGSKHTQANGINSSGEVVGWIDNHAGEPQHGFTWTPPAHEESKQ
jgi:probable HAF family extracellular repeat protein